jgi:hypothetical protein
VDSLSPLLQFAGSLVEAAAAADFRSSTLLLLSTRPSVAYSVAAVDCLVQTAARLLLSLLQTLIP